jgi:uncharacterized protein with PIN domain
MKDRKNRHDRFFCDAMLGGLAKWLRAAGYDTLFEYGIDDADLLRRAGDSGRMVLSSDAPLFERNVIKRGEVPALFVPRDLGKVEQLRFVMHNLGLKLREPRCMACGGELIEVPKLDVADEVPPKAFHYCNRFWRCGRCKRLLWRGTHWKRITANLERATTRD